MIGWLLRRPMWLLVGLAAVGGYALGKSAPQAVPHADLGLRAGMHLLQQRRRVLALGAAPGMLEREIGGTLWRLKQAGAKITVAVAAPSPTGGRKNAAEVTLRELEQAQAVLHYDRAELLPPLSTASQLMERIGCLWAEEVPDLVLAPAAGDRSRTRRWALQQATLAVAEERGELSRLGLYGSACPNTLVDVTRVLDQKWAGVRAYPSALTGPDPAHRLAIGTEGRRFSGEVPSQAVEGLYRL